MRRLTEQQVELIDAWLAQSGTNEVTPSLLEKDVHVTAALKVLQQIEHPAFNLVFCGGTSLSKAYGLIERMSEDLDMKVVPRQTGISRNSLKRQLRDLKLQVATVLSDIGLIEDEENRKCLDENRYIGMQWSYETMYGSHSSLRPHLRIELTTRTPMHPAETRSVGSMLDVLLNRQITQRVRCVVPAETLAEKVLSFLRRYAQHRAGKMDRTWDTALVRHIYDTHCIYMAQPEYLATAKKLFCALVFEDAARFGKQNPEFASKPKVTLANALIEAESDVTLVEQYRRFLLPLIYGETRPSYPEAFATFKRCTNELLSTVQDND